MMLFIFLSSASLFIKSYYSKGKKLQNCRCLSTSPQRCTLGEGKVPYILNWALDGGEWSVSCLLVRLIAVYFTHKPSLLRSLYSQVSFYTRVMLLKNIAQFKHKFPI